jgi:hypothetical protein
MNVYLVGVICIIVWLHYTFKYSASTDRWESNCHLPSPGRSYMTHRQATAATAAKILHTTVMLCLNNALSDGVCTYVSVYC